MNDPEVLVVGAGISGLSIARLLAREGVSVEVWEQGDSLGGKIQTQQHSGYLVEESASMVLNFRPEVNRFLAATQLEQHKVKRAQTEHRYLLRDNQLVELPLRLRAMARSRVWSTSGKLRMLLEPFAGSGDSERETVTEFVTRRLGREVLEQAIEPFVSGPLASDADRANAAATLPRLTGLEQRYGSITGGMLASKLLHRRTAMETEAFSFDGGMKRLIEMLAVSPNVRLRTGLEVTELISGSDGWIAIGQSSGTQHTLMTRHIVLSTPAEVTASLTAPLDAELATLLREIQYAPVSVVHMGFAETAIKRNLNGTGFLVPRREQLALTGCMWTSQLFPGHAPDGKVLLTNYLGGALHPEVVTWDDEQCVKEILRILKPLLKIKTDPEMVAIKRHQRALPLYYDAYPTRMQAIDSRLQRLPGLSLLSNYRGGVSIRDRIVCAYQALELILSSLHRSANDLKTTRLPRSNGLLSASTDTA